ncbi:MAG: photosystem II biogenesis protein Psp29 [Cyanothece sp. SIO2G6]|nr:photosystem II biogenesis protein Psp29 [Cyanothece sp. SIO2G6]
MSNIRTVSDTKRAFYSAHTRPISSIYRRVVEELMVEMHLLSVNVEFRYDPIYALGIVTAFDRFMQGYRPEEDLKSIFSALCSAVEGPSADQYRSDAEKLKGQLSQMSMDNLRAVLDGVGSASQPGLQSHLGAIAQASQFKYSRLFAIGVLTILELIDETLLTDETKLNEWLGRFSELLKLPGEKVEKDIEIYRGNLEKLRQAQEVLADVLKADRKKQMEREAGLKEGQEEDNPSGEAEKPEND